MKQLFDSLLQRVFNNPQTLWANIIFGILILLLGFYLMKKESSKIKNTTGLFCSLIGSIAIIINILKLFSPFF